MGRGGGDTYGLVALMMGPHTPTEHSRLAALIANSVFLICLENVRFWRYQIALELVGLSPVNKKL